MEDHEKSKKQLIAELANLRSRVAELENSEESGEQEDITESRRNQVILKASEEKYRTLFESCPDGILITDIETKKYKFANPAFCELLGYTEEEIKGLGIHDLHPKDKLEHVIAQFEAHARNEKSLVENIPFLKKDGTVVYVDATGVPTIIDGKYYSVGFFRDITESKQLEDRLYESEKRLQAIMDNAAAVIYLKDVEGRYLLINREYETLFHVTKEEVIGKTDYDIFPEEMAEAFISNDRKVVRTNAPLQIEEIAPQDDGPHTYISIKFPIHNADGTVYGICGISTDITDRKQAEKELQKRTHNLGERVKELNCFYEITNLFQNSDISMEEIIQDVVELIPASLQYPDITCARITFDGKEYTTENFRETPWKLIGEITVNGKSEGRLNVHYLEEMPEMDEGPFLKEERYLIDAIGKKLGRMIEKKLVEQKLQHYATELEQSNEEIKQFVYIVSHDLRAPLVNLKGFSAELRSAMDDINSAIHSSLPDLDDQARRILLRALDEDVPEALGFIESSATRMDDFITAVLRLSRMGRNELKLDAVDMSSLVNETLQTIAHQIGEREVKVTVGHLHEVIADKTSMEQITGNILTNAVLYLDPDRPGEIEITSENGANEITFHIRDNGRGIAEEDMEKVFAPFRRAGRQDVKGEGMGLSYVQTLVRRHGGRITCKSEPGVGTTFSFSISNRRGCEYA